MGIPSLRRNGDGRAFVEIPNSRRKRLYLGEYGSEAAESSYSKWLARHLSGDSSNTPQQTTASMTVTQLAELYLEWIDKEYDRKSSEFSHVKGALNHLNNLCGSLATENLGPAKLLELQEKLTKTTYKKGKQERLYSRHQINRIVAKIKRMVKWASSREIIPPEQFHKFACVEGLRQGKGRESKPVEAVSVQVLLATLPYMPHQFAVMAQVQYLCGMRPGEVCDMRVEWIDSSRNIWTYLPLEHKNTHRGKTLVKAVPVTAQRLMQPFLNQAGPAGPVFAGRGTGKPIRRDSYRNSVKGAIEKAVKAGESIPNWTPLQLRHGIATEIRKIAGQESAQLYLGHSSIDTTKIYAERSVESVIELASRFEATIFKPISEHSNSTCDI